VIPLGMEMVGITAQRPPQGALAEQDHLGQALLLDRPDGAAEKLSRRSTTFQSDSRATLCVPKIGFGVDAGNKRGKLAA
jgi:hypothetical protein